MALDSATNRVATCHMEETRTTTSSELSSESDGSDFVSDSDAYRILTDVEETTEYQYTPLNCDSDVDNVEENSSDESIALIAHEILCCEHDTDTETDSDDDLDLEAKLNYALLMCSEDDDDLDPERDQQKLHFEQEQKLCQLKGQQNFHSENPLK